MPTFVCPKCGATIEVKYEEAKKILHCPYCNAIMELDMYELGKSYSESTATNVSEELDGSD